MIHGMIEGRLCHYIGADGQHFAAVMIRAPHCEFPPMGERSTERCSKTRHVGNCDTCRESRVNLFVFPRSLAEVEMAVADVVQAGDSAAAAVTKVLHAFIHEGVPYLPPKHSAPNTYHWIEKAE